MTLETLKSLGEERIRLAEMANTAIKELQKVLQAGGFPPMRVTFSGSDRDAVLWLPESQKLAIDWGCRVLHAEASPIAARIAFYENIDAIIESFIEKGKLYKDKK